MSCSLSVPGRVWEEGWRLWALDIDLPLPALPPGVCRLAPPSHRQAHHTSPTFRKLWLPVHRTTRPPGPSRGGHLHPEPANCGHPWGYLLSLLLHGVWALEERGAGGGAKASAGWAHFQGWGQGTHRSGNHSLLLPVLDSLPGPDHDPGSGAQRVCDLHLGVGGPSPGTLLLLCGLLLSSGAPSGQLPAHQCPAWRL